MKYLILFLLLTSSEIKSKSGVKLAMANRCQVDSVFPEKIPYRNPKVKVRNYENKDM